jgi:hypothetical protein
MQREKKKLPGEKSDESRKKNSWGQIPYTKTKFVTNVMFKEAREKLRILDLEREILGYAVRRLYEASAEGKITEEERDKLAEKYKIDLARIKEEISRGESIVALNELERLQQEFVDLFSERFTTISNRIEDLKSLSGFQHNIPEESTETKEIEKPNVNALKQSIVLEDKKEKPLRASPKKQISPKLKKKLKPTDSLPEPESSNAEKKVEEIVAEVEKVLKKLGQMEADE